VKNEDTWKGMDIPHRSSWQQRINLVPSTNTCGSTLTPEEKVYIKFLLDV
jgi:hypothetical protein